MGDDEQLTSERIAVRREGEGGRDREREEINGIYLLIYLFVYLGMD